MLHRNTTSTRCNACACPLQLLGVGPSPLLLQLLLSFVVLALDIDNPRPVFHWLLAETNTKHLLQETEDVAVEVTQSGEVGLEA